MRRLIKGLAIVVGLVGVSAPYAAHADLKKGGSVFGSPAGDNGGLLNGNVTVFGVPDPKTGAISPKIGVKLDGSVYSKEWGGDGPCTAKLGVGNVSAEASLGVGLDPFFQGEYGPGASNPPEAAKTGTDGPGSLSCTLSAEASLVSIEGECKTPVGTFGASAKGVGAEASCGCDGCKAEAYWAKASGSYTTPAIGGCGISGKVKVEGGVMAGVGAGVKKVGDAGGGITLGPLEVGIGVQDIEFDLGATADCLVNAGKAIAGAAVAIGEGIVDIGSSIIGGIGDIGGGIVDGIGGFFGGGGGGGKVLSSIGGFFGGGGGGMFGGLFGGGGDNSGRNDSTTAVAGNNGGANSATGSKAGGAGWTGALGRD